MIAKNIQQSSVFRYVCIVAAIAVLVLSLMPAVLGGFSAHYTKVATQYVTDQYNPGKALRNYEKAFILDSSNKEALYNAARLYSMMGRYEDAERSIEHYVEMYPAEHRIHYIAGLNYAFKKDVPRAEQEFEQFVASGQAQWPGYLDLAWVKFQLGKFDQAEALLTEAQTRFGGNAWVSTSLGAVYIAQGDHEKAEDMLHHAKAQAHMLTRDEWANNYTFNNPADFEAGMAQMRAVIDANLAIARGSRDVMSVTQALNSLFIGVSPAGYPKGIVLAACGDSCTTSSCFSEANACGQVVSGTRNSCTNICSAGIAPLPNGYGDTCTVKNACGQSAQGTIGCDGMCSAQMPACQETFAPSISSAGQCTTGRMHMFTVVAQDPQGDRVRYAIDWDANGVVDQYVPSSGFVSSGIPQDVGHIFSATGMNTIRVRTEDEGGALSSFTSYSFACNEVVNEVEESAFEGNSGSLDDTFPGDTSDGGDVAGDLIAQPNLIRVGLSSTLVWDTSGVESCRVMGSNGDSFSGTSGSRTTSPITSKTVYTLTCDNGAVVDTAIVNILPSYQEI